MILLLDNEEGLAQYRKSTMQQTRISQRKFQKADFKYVPGDWNVLRSNLMTAHRWLGLTEEEKLGHDGVPEAQPLLECDALDHNRTETNFVAPPYFGPIVGPAIVKPEEPLNDHPWRFS